MRVSIRLASAADADQICEIYAPIVRDTHISFEQDIPDSNEMSARIEQTLTRYPWLVCEIDGRIAGYAYASPFRRRKAYQWTAETTVYVRPSFKRRGIARGLYASLTAILRAQGFCNAIGVIAMPNPASIGIHEAMGFRKVGVLTNMGYKAGDWRDTGWWQLELRRPLGQPAAPLTLTSLSRKTAMETLLQTGLPYLKPIRLQTEDAS